MPQLAIPRSSNAPQAVNAKVQCQSQSRCQSRSDQCLPTLDHQTPRHLYPPPSPPSPPSPHSSLPSQASSTQFIHPLRGISRALLHPQKPVNQTLPHVRAIRCMTSHPAGSMPSPEVASTTIACETLHPFFLLGGMKMGWMVHLQKNE